MIKVKNLVEDDDVSIEYPAGTRTVSIAENYVNSPMIDLDKLIYMWRKEWDDTETSHEDLFITVGFATGQIIYEISDRMRDK